MSELMIGAAEAPVSMIALCDCGNPEMGFNCCCSFVARYPGDLSFRCDFCGIVSGVSRPQCNRCEAFENTTP
jgi:hypothetical protein